MFCIRVPKSGSSSLRQLLDAAFAVHRVFEVPKLTELDASLSRFQAWRLRRSQRRVTRRLYGQSDLARAIALINREAKPGDLIGGGHFSYPEIQRLIHQPGRIITLLRDPVARAVSDYNFAREGYLRRLPWRRFDSGLSAKMAGRYSLEGYLDWLLEHADVYGNIASTFLGWDGAQPLAAFFADHVFHAGVLERKERFAAGLSEKMGKPLAFPWENKTGKREVSEVSAAVRQRIERLHARDFALYAFTALHAG